MEGAVRNPARARLLIAALLILLAGATWVVSVRRQPPATAAQLPADPPVALQPPPPAPASAAPVTAPPVAAGAGPATDTLPPALQQHRLDEMTSWAERRGYGRGSMRIDAKGQLAGQEFADPYEAYQNEQLRSLAAQGDPWAQQLLAARILKTIPSRLTPAQIEEATNLLLAASARGYTSSLLKLSELSMGRSGTRAARESPALKEQLQTDHHAYLLVAERLGDLSATQWRHTMQDDPQTGAGFDQRAGERADEIYADLRATRSGLGLGEFEELPVSVRETNDQLYSRFVEPVISALQNSAKEAAARRAHP